MVEGSGGPWSSEARSRLEVETLTLRDRVVTEAGQGWQMGPGPPRPSHRIPVLTANECWSC